MGATSAAFIITTLATLGMAPQNQTTQPGDANHATTRESGRSGIAIFHVRRHFRAAELRLRPGDVILGCNGEPAESAQDFIQKFEAAQKAAQDGAVQLQVRTHQETKTLTARRGWLGMIIINYPETCETPLLAALRAHSENRFTEARTLFEEAYQKGLERKKSMTGFAYAVACYYTGDVEKAHQLIREQAERYAGDKPWIDLHAAWMGSFESEMLADGMPLMSSVGVSTSDDDRHLGLFIRRECLKRYPKTAEVKVEVAHYLNVAVHNYPESIATWLKLIAEQPDDHEIQRVANDNLCAMLRDMRLMPELRELCRNMAKNPDDVARGCRRRIAESAELAGDLDTAVQLQQQDYPELSPQDELFGPPPQFWWLLRLHVRLGQIDKAKALIQKLPRPAIGCFVDGANTRDRPFMCGWSELAPIWGELAREAWHTCQDDPEKAASNQGTSVGQLLEPLFDALSSLPNPDADELEKICRAHKNAWRVWTNRARFTIAVVRGDYEEALHVTEELPANRDPSMPQFAESEIEAAEFLTRFGPEFNGERAPWRLTRHAFPIPAGGWVLVTLDRRIGLASADAQTIRQLPSPERDWCPPSPELIHKPEFLAVSRTGTTVVMCGNRGQIYVLGPDRTSWKPMLRFSPSTEYQFLNRIQSVLDECTAPDGMFGNGAVEIAWPEVRPYVSLALPTDNVRLMLSDGDWWQWDTREHRVLPLSQWARKSVDPKTRIFGFASPYHIPPYFYDNTRFAFSSHGVLEFSHKDDKVRLLPFPDGDKQGPVMQLLGGNSQANGVIRLGLLPDAGGKTYRLDPETSTLTPEGCINESYPITYWQTLPPDECRKAIQAACSRAGVKWPFAAPPE